jgi:NAD dependent epimerase/dehydratase family enzyme
MADEVILSSARAVPQRLLQSGFTFEYPQLPQALAAIIQESI